MAPPDLRSFLEQSFALLRDEAPAAHRRLHRSLDRLGLCIVEGGRRFAVQCETDRLVTGTVNGDTAVVTAVECATILALVDGELPLEQAIREDRLFVRGGIRDVAAAFDALSIYLRGAIRCPSFPALLNAYRSAAS